MQGVSPQRRTPCDGGRTLTDFNICKWFFCQALPNCSQNDRNDNAMSTFIA
jgi:hypothetical protein